MAATCIDCAEKLPIGRRLLGFERCKECEAQYQRELVAERERRERVDERAKAQRREQIEAFWDVLGQLRYGAPLSIVLPRIEAAGEISGLAELDVLALKREAFQDYVDEALADDVVDPSENLGMGEIARTLGVGLGGGRSKRTRSLLRRYRIACCNSGLMPRVEKPRIFLKQDETAYHSDFVSIVKETVRREFETISHSVSFPLGHGIRYRSGYARSRPIVVGREITVEDSGQLVVTSQRVVFAGAKQVIEVPYRRLVGLQVGSISLGLQIANRKSVPTFRMEQGNSEVAAAVINAAAQFSQGTFVAAQPSAPIPTLPPPPLPAMLAETGWSDPSESIAAEGPGTSPPEGDSAAAPSDATQDDIEKALHQLAKMPGFEQEAAAIRDLCELDAFPAEVLFKNLIELNGKAASHHFPPALTPLPRERWGEEPPPKTRDFPSRLESTLDAFRELGLSAQQVDGLRHDYEREQCSDAQLEALRQVLPEVLGTEEPEEPDEALESESTGASSAEPALLVYNQCGAGSRSRELLEVLARAESALTPAMIAEQMRPDETGGPMARASVRATIRNVRRVEKGLLAREQLERRVLVIDYTEYGRDGAARYSLSPEDRRALTVETG